MLFAVFLLSLQTQMNKIILLLFLLFSCPSIRVVAAQDFMTTEVYSLRQKSDRASFSAKIEFPLQGGRAVLRGVREWICEMLLLDNPKQIDESTINALLRQSCTQFLHETESGSRQIEIYRSFEDERLVTYELLVTDKGTETWRSEDCVSFSKRDGHRLRVGEIFKCSERQICELMWANREGIPVDAEGPQDLCVGNVGITDGWIVVIGPAWRFTGAGYRIRFEDAEPYLQNIWK